MASRSPKRLKFSLPGEGDVSQDIPDLAVSTCRSPNYTLPAPETTRGPRLELVDGPLTQRVCEKKPKRQAKGDKNGKASQNKGKSNAGRGLRSFFSAITQTQASSSSDASPGPIHNMHQDQDDWIEDDPLSEPPINKGRGSEYSTRIPITSPQNSTKRLQNSQPLYIEVAKRFVVPGSHIFGSETGKAYEKKAGICSTTWAESYPPQGIGELAVQPKKIEIIRTWLQQTTNSGLHKNLLVLKGPSGCGKSAAIRTIARTLGIRIIDWDNPIGDEYGSEVFISRAAQFEEFLNRNSKYNALETTIPQQDQSVRSVASTICDGSKSRSLVLVKDIPNTSTRNHSSLLSFRSSVLRYIAPSGMWKKGNPENLQNEVNHPTPLVILITETQATQAGTASDSITVGKLLGTDIINHPATTIVELNPVSPALMVKALNRIVNKQETQGWSPDAKLVKSISQSGDIRNAISCLEFMFASKCHRADINGHKPFWKQGPHRICKQEVDPAPAVGHRDTIIDIFHAVGKVVYNKRIDNQSARGMPPQPPVHHVNHMRRQASEVSSEELMRQIGTDTETFVAALHENYIASCTGEDLIDCFNGCAEALSTADLLDTSPSFAQHFGRGSVRQYSARDNVDTSKQIEFTFETAVRGLLFALPYPVKRGEAFGFGARKCRDPFKLGFPTSHKLWRQIANSTVMLRSCTYAVGTRSPCTLINPAEMVQEYLPIVSKIKPELLGDVPRQDLQSLVSFSTLISPSLDTTETVAYDPAAAFNQVEPAAILTDSASLYSRDIQATAIPYSLSTASLPSEKLVLSDDDIEDG